MTCEMQMTYWEKISLTCKVDKIPLKNKQDTYTQWDIGKEYKHMLNKNIEY